MTMMGQTARTAQGSAAFLVCGGRLGDHYGRRLMFCAGLALFTITSALCAAAPDAGPDRVRRSASTEW